MATGDIRISVDGLGQLDQLVTLTNTLHLRLDQLEATLTTRLDRIEATMAATQDDIDRTIQAAITAFADRTEASIAGIRQDFADFKTANPGVNIAALEDTVNTRLGAIADSAAELDAENPPATPPS